jgi:dolichol kinase
MTTKGKINFYRKIWHFFSGFFIIALMMLSYPSKTVAVIFLASFSAALLALDILRFTTAEGDRFFWKHLGFLTSEKERRGPNTSFYYAGSILVCVLVFQPKIAMSSIVCLAAGDPAAGIFGKLIGKHRIGGKSIEGALVNFTLCMGLIRFIIPSTGLAVIGAFAGALVELLPIPWLDDNISVPIVSGLAMAAANAFIHAI